VGLLSIVMSEAKSPELREFQISPEEFLAITNSGVYFNR
jgi:hypothetical protein